MHGREYFWINNWLWCYLEGVCGLLPMWES